MILPLTGQAFHTKMRDFDFAVEFIGNRGVRNRQPAHLGYGPPIGLPIWSIEDVGER